MQVETQNSSQTTPIMSRQELQRLGMNTIAYLRPLRQQEADQLAEKFAAQFAERFVEPIPDVSAHQFWGLFGAAGEICAFSNNRDELTEVASQNQLILVPIN